MSDWDVAIDLARQQSMQEAMERPTLTFRRFVEQTVAFKLHDWQVWIADRFGKLPFQTGQRILMHGPPQYGKSVITSQRLPAYYLGVKPASRVGLACYNISHAATFGDVVKNLMQSSEYQHIFPASRIPRQCSSEAFKTVARSQLEDATYSWLAMGLQTGFVGKGFGPGDLLIIDDPYASAEDARSETINDKTWRWYKETAKVRCDPQCNIVVFFHRYHEDDFAGRLLAEGGWEYYRFPAIADGDDDDPTGRQIGELLSPMRSREYLENIQATDQMTWLGQFQGRPRPPEGAIIKREWLKTVESKPVFDVYVRFWDLATTETKRNDFYAGALCAVGEDQTFYLLDMARFKATWPDATEIIANIAEQDDKYCKAVNAKYHIGVEKVAWQLPMIQDMFRNRVTGRMSLWPVRPVGDKVERAGGWIARAKYDMFRMVRAVWNQEFIDEAVVFDGSDVVKDDQIDAVSGAYDLIWQIRGGRRPDPVPVVPGSYEHLKQLFGWRGPDTSGDSTDYEINGGKENPPSWDSSDEFDYL